MFNRSMQTFWLVSSNLYYYLTDFTVLPEDAPDDLLTAPTATSPVFIAIAISFSILFFLSFTSINLRHKMHPKVTGLLEMPMLLRASAWVGVFGFLLGTKPHSILIVRDVY